MAKVKSTILIKALTLAFGRVISAVALVILSGQTGPNTQGTSTTMSKKGTELTHGITATCIPEIGSTTNGQAKG